VGSTRSSSWCGLKSSEKLGFAGYAVRASYRVRPRPSAQRRHFFWGLNHARLRGERHRRWVGRPLLRRPCASRYQTRAGAFLAEPAHLNRSNNNDAHVYTVWCAHSGPFVPVGLLSARSTDAKMHELCKSKRNAPRCVRTKLGTCPRRLPQRMYTRPQTASQRPGQARANAYLQDCKFSQSLAAPARRLWVLRQSQRTVAQQAPLQTTAGKPDGDAGMRPT